MSNKFSFISPSFVVLATPMVLFLACCYNNISFLLPFLLTMLYFALSPFCVVVDNLLLEQRTSLKYKKLAKEFEGNLCLLSWIFECSFFFIHIQNLFFVCILVSRIILHYFAGLFCSIETASWSFSF